MAHTPIDQRVDQLETALVRLASTLPEHLLGDVVGTSTLFALKLGERARKFCNEEEEQAAFEAVALASAACKDLLADQARANGRRRWNGARRFG